MTAPMNTNFLCRHAACAAVLLFGAGATLSAPAAPFEPVMSLAKKEKAPLLELTPANAALAKYAQTIYAELGKELVIGDVAEGGGTDLREEVRKIRNEGTENTQRGVRKIRRTAPLGGSVPSRSVTTSRATPSAARPT